MRTIAVYVNVMYDSFQKQGNRASFEKKKIRFSGSDAPTRKRVVNRSVIGGTGMFGYEKWVEWTEIDESQKERGR